METNKTRQQSMFSFLVKMPPQLSALPRPSQSTKRSIAEKRRPGRPRKKTRHEDWSQYWHDAVENEWCSTLQVWESYESSIIGHFTDKPSKEPVRPKKFQATYTVERKFEVREFALANSGYSYQQIADAFKMPKTTVFDIIKQNPCGGPAKGRGNKKGAGRRLSYSQETEDQLVQWVLEMRDLHLPVSVVQVKEKARQLIQPQVPSFKASDGWAYKFFHRNHFTLRAKTSLSQRLPAGLEGKMKLYLQKLQKERKNGRFPLALIGNMDETPVYFDLVPGKTIDQVGVKSCVIRSTGAEKRHITVVLTVAADGSMLPPMVIFKGKRRLKLTAHEGVLVCVQTKAWMDEELMKEYLKHIWQPYVEETAERLGLPDHNALLLLDSFKAHTTDSITKMMKEQDTTHCIIPGGCTSKLQPLDVSINKPFKQILKGCWSNFIHTSVMAASDHTAKIKTATKQQVLDWVVNAWQRMKERKELITKSFQVTGITSSDPDVVRSDDVLKRALEAVQRELNLTETGEEDEDDLTEDSFADIELED